LLGFTKIPEKLTKSIKYIVLLDKLVYCSDTDTSVMGASTLATLSGYRGRSP